MVVHAREERIGRGSCFSCANLGRKDTLEGSFHDGSASNYTRGCSSYEQFGYVVRGRPDREEKIRVINGGVEVEC